MLKYIQHAMKGWVSLDVRSLALFRVCLGLVLLLDLAGRLPDLANHYSDRGVFPRAALLTHSYNRWFWSFHLMSGETLFQGLLFAIAALFAIFLLLGYRTRFFTIASWALLISLHNSNWTVLNAGDEELRLLLFWGILLPLGAAYSVDRTLTSKKNKPPPAIAASSLPLEVCSMATLGLTLQICYIYWVAGLLKSHPIWWPDGTAVYYALNFDRLATPLGRFLLNFPGLLKILSFSTLAIELIGPFLLFIPVRAAFFRTCAVALFVSLHLGFSLGLNLGIFPLVSVTAWLAFIPGEVWDFVIPKLKAGSQTGWLPHFNRWKMRLHHTIAQFERKQGLIQRKSDSFVGPTSRWQQLFATIGLICVTYWNVHTIAPKTVSVRQPFKAVSRILRLDQRWSMFAPYPNVEDGWYVIPAYQKNGVQVDLFQAGAPVTWEKPASIPRLHRSVRWRKYLEKIWLKKHRKYRQYYGAYLCRHWNESHQGDEHITQLQIYYLLEKTPPPGTVGEDIRPVKLWEHKCKANAS